MTKMHNLLKRQLKKFFDDSPVIPDRLQHFIDAVNKAYKEFDIDRNMLERSLDLSSHELLQANSEMRALIQAFPDLLFRIDSHGKILDYKFGVGGKADLFFKEDLIGKHIQDVPMKDISRKFQEAIEKVLQTKDMVSIEYSLLLKGNESFYEARLLPLPEDHIMVIIRNNTNRVIAEKALIESEKKYRTLADNALVGVFKTNIGGKILYANKALSSMLEFDSPEDILSINAHSSYKNPNDRRKFIASLQKTGVISDFAVDFITNKGKLKHVIMSATLEDDIISGMIMDVTERKRLETQLIKAQKLDAVGTLAGGIAHDFNNILTAIISYTSILSMKMSKNDPMQVYLKRILDSSNKAAALVKSLLAFGRKQIMDPKPVEINSIIKNIANLLKRLIGENIELNMQLSEYDLVVIADEGQLEQVMMNLATNARDAISDVGILTIGTELFPIDEEFINLHGYGEPGTYALITITDTGEGMNEKTREQIFEPFFTTKETGKGTGLGLAMVYGIINQHSGYITCYSEPKSGTTFRIYLPLIEAPVEDQESRDIPPLPSGTETILLCEDDTDVRSAAHEVLTGSGYTVIESVDGEDAIGKFSGQRDKRIQLLITDVVMPRKNGKELYEEIKKLQPDIKVLFISGYTANQITRKGVLEPGMNFISKPFLSHDFLNKVREVLDK
jgi:PAS domain S-box-containing protein